MTAGQIVAGIIALMVAYLLGSIPSAYIAAHLIKGKDIRRMGWGNVGAGNTFREVGKVAGITVGIFDVGKGAAAVAIAHWLLGAPYFFVLASGVAAVAGHIWPVYLKFTGGRGLAITIGVLSIVLTRELLIALALTIPLVVLTRNFIFSITASLLSVPISGWFLEKSGEAVVFPIIVLLVMLARSFPGIMADITRAGSFEKFVAELLWRNKTTKKEG